MKAFLSIVVVLLLQGCAVTTATADFGYYNPVPVYSYPQTQYYPPQPYYAPPPVVQFGVNIPFPNVVIQPPSFGFSYPYYGGYSHHGHHGHHGHHYR